ncbi:hypothetical protein J1N35_033799 [Gossypium stocksii]|uniref:Uncharacterized protein n=1 Tax=Gossypium stocksii TaxID=47602 RepID=A0A9D3ZPG8_9ROSI|nr:hypothetical protein J1N35_033799 [Gossypium stocksii]
MQRVLNSTVGKLTERNDAFKAMRSVGATLNRKINVLKPKEFTGTRFASNVGNFLWGIEQYFRAKGIMDNATKVNIVVMYFTDVVLLWWHHKSTNERRGGTVIGTWVEFQKEFKEFSELILQISNLSEKKTLFFFMDGLKPWANMSCNLEEFKNSQKP